MAHKVVIIGGGFGGLYAAKALKDAPVEVTVIDRRNFHLFQPLLYQVATGALSAGEIAAPLRGIFRRYKNTTTLLGEVVDFDVQGRRLILKDGDELPYDSVIVAAGSTNFFFGNDKWEEFAPGLKTIEDATRIRHKILYAFEAAEREHDPEKRRAWLTFIIVGAGPTGVELAGALSEIANDVMKDDFRSIDPEEARIILLDGSPRVLPPFDPTLSKSAEKQLIGLGVRPRNNVRVTGIDEHGVVFKGERGEERIDARTVLWAAGVKASPLAKILEEKAGAQLDKGGRVMVQPDCSVPGHPEILVIGDMAYLEQDGKPLPGVAPTAMQQGSYVGKLIENRIKGRSTDPFRYWDKGSLAVIGRAAGVAQLGKLKFSGLPAWLLWLFVHLMYLVSFQNRLIVFFRWGFDYVTFNRGARLITGEPEPTEDEKRLHRLLLRQ